MQGRSHVFAQIYTYRRSLRLPSRARDARTISNSMGNQNPRILLLTLLTYMLARRFQQLTLNYDSIIFSFLCSFLNIYIAKNISRENN